MSVTLLQNVPLRDVASRHLAEHPEGSALYPAGSLSSAAAVEKRASTLNAWSGDRHSLQQWLNEQNAFSPLHPAQAKNLAAVAQPDSLFVLTGQQPGLLGGPALWFCKAMTCAAWARTWTERLKRPMIPVFWVAGDDSDLAECNAVEWPETSALRRSFSLEFDEPSASIPMSLRSLPPDGLEELQKILRATWDRETAEWATTAYQPGRNLTQAFLHLAQKVLGPEGILFVDGFSAATRTQSFLRRIVAEAQAFHEAVGQGSRRMSQVLSMPPQVPLRHGAVPVFTLRDSARARLFFPDSGGRVYIQGDEGHDVLPELKQHRLLHSALSRPLVVEELFPTLGHVLGPAELRYFGQLTDVFPAFGKSFPLLAPRQQLIACSRNDWTQLAELGLNAEDLPGFSPSRLRTILSEKAWKNHPAAKEFPDRAFGDFTAGLKRYQEKQLPGRGPLDAGMRRLEGAFERYRTAAKQAVFAREASETYASFASVLRWLGNGAQDRHLNLLSLRNALGAEGFAGMTELLHGGDAATSVVVYD
jgi:uncharacterized protein YllA (UPF0747 family)